MRFLWLVAAPLLLACGFLYVTLSTVLHTSQEVAVLLAGIPLGLAGLILTKRNEATQVIQQKIAPTWNRSTFAAYLFASIVLVSTYLLIAFIFILRISILFQDEWRTHNDYIFERGFWRSIFERQNEHLTIVPSFLYQVNYYLFDDNEFWLLLLNTGMLLVIGWIFTSHLYAALRPKMSRALSITSCSILLFSIFWLASDVMLFWTVGISNNLGALGAVLAATVLAKANSLTSLTTIALFALCALLSSFSFGGGVATWAFGFLAALFLANNTKITFGYLAFALLGGFATVGYYVLTDRGTEASSFMDLVMIVPTLIGAPFTFLFRSFLSSDSLPLLALGIGLIGIVTGLFWLYYFFIKLRPKMEKLPTNTQRHVLFFTLVALFVVGCALLIGLSRGNGNFAYALSDRYHHLSVLFWNSFLSITLIFLANQSTPFLKKWLIPSILGIVFVGLTIFNVVKLDVRMYGYNEIAKAKMDLIVHPDKLGEEVNLWQAQLNRPYFQEIVVKVAKHLKQERKNIYAADWTHLVGVQLTDHYVVEDSNNQTFNLTLSPKTEQNDVVFTGWILPNSMATPKLIACVQGGIIIGWAIPASDRLLDRPEQATATFLPKPFKHLPGICRYYYGQINTDLGTESFEASSIRFYGIYHNGKAILLEQIL